MENAKLWADIYESTDFGNRWRILYDRLWIAICFNTNNDYSSYKEYEHLEKDKDGMVNIKEADSIQQGFRVNLPRNKREMQ